jgi:gluconate 2-dehydrogenase gamma chain
MRDEEEKKENSSEDVKKVSTQKMEDNDNQMSRRDFLKLTAAGVVGAAVGAAVEYPIMSQRIQQREEQIDQLEEDRNQLQETNEQLQNRLQDFQDEITSFDGITTLSIDEQILLEAVVETIIPSEQNSPGAKEAGVIFFIDRQLTGDYGTNARMYMEPPYIRSGTVGPITVDGITYPQGAPSVPFPASQRYQYAMPLREFWRYGLESLQNYSNDSYGQNFEDLNNDQKVNVLTDLANNVPTEFAGILPVDFFNEVIFMTWSGFLMDPKYGGNRGMVGWLHTGFNGVNMGDFYNEGYRVTELMVSDQPIRLMPASLGQFQRRLGFIGQDVGRGRGGS